MHEHAPSYETGSSNDSVPHVGGFAWNCVEHVDSIIGNILELCSGNSVWIGFWMGCEKPYSKAIAEKCENREDKIKEGSTSHQRLSEPDLFE
jgi:hypothetical protein